MESILVSTKLFLGIPAEETPFDETLVMHINSVLMILNHIGVGLQGFQITGMSETWDQFLEGRTDLAGVKTYMYAKVRMLFDPPQSSTAAEALKSIIAEMEYRLYTITNYEVT